jgi:hypothetical protein
MIFRQNFIKTICHDFQYFLLFFPRRFNNGLQINGKTPLLPKRGTFKSMELSIDWIHNLIYFNENHQIIVFHLLQPQYNFLVISEKSGKINDLSINPLKSFIVYSVWGIGGRIMKALQDGSNKTVVIEERYSYPGSLAVDILSEKIFWVDILLHELSSIDFEGNNYQTILRSKELFSIPTSIAVFDDSIYWSNNMDHSVYKINKFGLNGTQIDFLFKSEKFTNFNRIKIIDSSLQPNSTNRCINANCSHLCIPVGIDQYRCVCPHFILLRDFNVNHKNDDEDLKICTGSVRIN